MKKLVQKIVKNILEKMNTKNEQYNIEKLEEFCSPFSIPKEFKSSENISELEEELKAFSLGCKLFKEITGHKYKNDKLEDITEIKEAGIYQFLQATLQDEVTSIISDEYYLEKLLNLYGKDKDIEEFDKKLIHGVVDKYSTVGLLRDINQDRLKVSRSGNILIVADGVGGGEHGEVASQKASDTAFDYLDTQIYNNKTKDEIEEQILKDLTTAIMNANKAVIAYADKESIDTIGTTLSIALIYDKKLYVGHVGDSRIYRIRENEKPESITEDHSLPEVLFRSGEIKTPEEKKNYKKNILVYVIGKRDLKEENLHVFCEEEELTNDMLFLCSDGVWDLKNGEVEEKFSGNIEELKRYILDSVPSDNATFIRCKFNYEVKEPISTFITQEDKVEEVVESIIPNDWQIKKEDIVKEGDEVDLIVEKETKDSFDKKILWSLLGTLLLGIGYLLFSSDSSVEHIDSNQSKIVVENNASVKIKNNDELNTSIRTFIDKNLTASSNSIVEENATKSLSEIEIPTERSEEVQIPKKEPIIKDESTSLSSQSNQQSLNNVEKIPEKTQSKNSNVLRVPRVPRVPRVTKVTKVQYRIDKWSSGTYHLSLTSKIGKKKIIGVSFKEYNLISTEKCFFKYKDNTQLICKLKDMSLKNPENITSQLESQKFAKIILLGVDNERKKKKEVRIVITLKDECKMKNESNLKSIDFECKKKQNTLLLPMEKAIIKKKPIVLATLRPWGDSDGLYLGKTLVLTFKKNKITLNRGYCIQEGIKWVCLVPRKQISNFKDITGQLRHQGFAESIFLNMDKSNSNVRVIITLKDGYKAVKQKHNRKNILSFYKK